MYENRPSIDQGLRVASLCQISVSSLIILHYFCPLASDTENPAMTAYSESFCQFWKSVPHIIPLCKQKTKQNTMQSHYRDSPKVTRAWKVIAEIQFLQFWFLWQASFTYCIGWSEVAFSWWKIMKNNVNKGTLCSVLSRTFIVSPYENRRTGNIEVH